MNDELKLLVEWSSPWKEFRSSLRPAFARSERPLAGEAHLGIFPYRGMLAGWVVEILLFLLVVILPSKLTMHTFQAPPPAKYDVIYYSGNELPQTADEGGAQSGRSGRSGGREGFHRTQTIHVARGSILRETVVDAPKLNLPLSEAAVANLLAYARVPGPPPAEGLKSIRPLLQAPQLKAVPPAPDVNRAQLRDEPLLNATAVPPAPTAPQQNAIPLPVPGSNAVQVVPPPVSAPEQMSNLNPKLALPRQAVVAPPPSHVTEDLARTGPGYGQGELHTQIVPPPVQMSNAVGERSNVSGLGSSRVVPPPVQVAGLGNGTSDSLGNGVGSAVGPAPSLSTASSLGGRGRGTRGVGFGGAGELGDVAAPPNGGGTSAGTGVVVSNQPGSKTGVPGKGGIGALALSPQGGPVTGLGGSGEGSGIGRGKGTGSGFSGPGSGAGKEGSGYGSDLNARGGTSPFPGRGGTGTGANGNPPIPGVSVRGGNSSIITLPSFSSGANQPSDPSRSSAGLADRRQEITVEASPRSGGAFNFYGALKGDKVYTIYMDTTLGTAVLEFSDPSSAAHPYAQDLTAPQPIRAVLPAGLRRSRLVIACVLDRSGILRNPQVLESVSPQMTAKVLAALPGWKFRPALRGNRPVEVNALLGFAIDTSDRY